MTNQAPPEGQLIANAQKRLGLSARKASAAAGISDSRWRHIINGYQPVGNGQTIPVRAPADTLARMAHAVGVNPAELAEAGRGDAAEEQLMMFPVFVDQAKDAPWIRLSRAMEARIAELGFKSDIHFAKAKKLDVVSVAKAMSGKQAGSPDFYRALELALEWQPGSVDSACQGAPAIRLPGSIMHEISRGKPLLKEASNAELLAEVARRFSSSSEPNAKAPAHDPDDPANYDLAAHPSMEIAADWIDSEFDQLGEENQDPDH